MGSVLVCIVVSVSCSGASPGGVDAGFAAPGSSSAPTGTSNTPGTTASATRGTTPAGTAVVGAADVTSTVATDGSTTTVAGAPSGPSTTRAPGNASTPPTIPGAVPTVPAPTAAPTTIAPTTTASKVTLSAGGPGGDETVHCMGGVTSAMATATWTTTNATQVAVALGFVADAFASPYNQDLSKLNGSYPVPIGCTGVQYTTVSARGPGGPVTVHIRWEIHTE